MNELFLDSKNKFCLKHMYQNFKQKFEGNKLKNLFKGAASGGNEMD